MRGGCSLDVRDLTVTNNAKLPHISVESLDVANDLHVGGDLTASGLEVTDLRVDGKLTASGDVQLDGDVTASGRTTLEDLTINGKVIGDIIIAGDVNQFGKFSLKGGFDATELSSFRFLNARVFTATRLFFRSSQTSPPQITTSPDSSEFTVSTFAVNLLKGVFKMNSAAASNAVTITVKLPEISSEAKLEAVLLTFDASPLPQPTSLIGSVKIEENGENGEFTITVRKADNGDFEPSQTFTVFANLLWVEPPVLP